MDGGLDTCPDFPDRILRYPNDASAYYTRRLRTLHLSGLFLTDHFMDAVTAASPFLEEVHLHNCSYMWMRLASGSLKKLFIERYCDGFGYGGPLVLALPRIASLHIDGRAPLIIFEGEMPSLVSASVTRSACDDDLGNVVLCALRDVRSLDLTGFLAPDLLLVDDEAMPVFRNLRTLLLDTCELGAECHALRRFLSNAPGLQTLTLRNCIFLGVSGSPGRETTSSDNYGRGQTTTAYYPLCNNLSSIELEFEDGYDHDISELVYAAWPSGAWTAWLAFKAEGARVVQQVARKWIHRGLERCPAEFDLCCYNDEPGACSNKKWPPFPIIILDPQSHPGVHTCRLRTLCLSGLHLSSDFVDRITDECPVLEDMHLEDCTYEYERLASHSLRKLFLDRYTTAELGIHRALRDVTNLELTRFSAKAMPIDAEPDEALSVFRNLRTLVLDACELGLECRALRSFLHNAPNLETLTVRDCTVPSGSRQEEEVVAIMCPGDWDETKASYGGNLIWTELEYKQRLEGAFELTYAVLDVSKEMDTELTQQFLQDGVRRVKIWYR
ncbi:hypothetical protein PR202_gb15587 [Eleusine coracana subsp. coracana]|uniref:Uncharacterized protein n=1 Tax=Eleusine coracana subsp. coracana TaxID=191504 RepID=A0AAV5EXI6_ELECO|nr:hypothetical protein PR202_gb15587 [Eleusine coracana subsp. coracana]